MSGDTRLLRDPTNSDLTDDEAHGARASGALATCLAGGLHFFLELCTSEVLLAELQGVLGRGKFANCLIQAGLTPQALVDDLRELAVVVAPTNVPRVVPTDPGDDHRGVTSNLDLTQWDQAFPANKLLAARRWIACATTRTA
jgi:hypothetical protein